MVIKCNKPLVLVGEYLLPCIPFVTRLPDGMISQANEDILKINEHP